MSKPVAVSGLGMTSCLGQGAKVNAAAMRCSYSNFLPTEFYTYGNSEPQLGAAVAGSFYVGTDHLLELSIEAIEHALIDSNLPFSELPLVVVFPTKKESLNAEPETFYNDFFTKLQATYTELEFTKDSSFLRSGRVGVVEGISKAQTLLYDRKYDHALLLCVDSLLNNHRISLYENYNDIPRLLADDYFDAFIPGEAAIALLLTRPNGTGQTCITGLGYSEEKAIIGSDIVLKAQGLTQAIQNAAKDANCKVCETDFIISSVNGESYFFKEVSLARTKSLEKKVATHPLWHTADNIGDVGAAVGGAIILLGHYAFEGKYAPGKRALCVVSNDDEARGAFILERLGG